MDCGAAQRLSPGQNVLVLRVFSWFLGATARKNCRPTQAADEAAVRQADENWSKAAQSKLEMCRGYVEFRSSGCAAVSDHF
jgi:hypothetical protein